MSSRRGWFADYDSEGDGWQPCFETRTGHIPCFEMWFASKAECEQWIRDTIIGVEMLDQETTPM